MELYQGLMIVIFLLLGVIGYLYTVKQQLSAMVASRDAKIVELEKKVNSKRK